MHKKQDVMLFVLTELIIIQLVLDVLIAWPIACYVQQPPPAIVNTILKYS